MTGRRGHTGSSARAAGRAHAGGHRVRWALAALSRRRGQAVGLLVWSAVVTACLSLIPLATRALEQAVLKPPITLQPPVATALVIDLGSNSPDGRFGHENPDDGLEREYARLGPQAQALYPRGVTKRTASFGSTRVFPAPAKTTAVELLDRDDVCRHLRFPSGRCPSAADEIAVSAGDAAAYGWTVGQKREWEALPAGQAAPPGVEIPRRSFAIVGVYEQIPDESYWLGLRLGGNAKVILESGVLLDEWITVPQTMQGWPVMAQRSFPAYAPAATIDDLPRAVEQVAAAQAAAASGVRIEAHLDDVHAEATVAAGQIRVLVPLVMGQLALLVAAVLLAVARAAVDERRSEVALARLRGSGAAGARRLLAAELLPPVLVGVPVGVAAAFAGAAALRAWVLPAGVPFEVGPALVVAVAAAVVLGVGAVYVAMAPLARSGVTTLLQRVRASRAEAGPLTWVVAALAVAAVVVLRTSSDPTPLALAAPTLLALALGLIVAALAPRFADRASARALRRGHAASGLAWAGVARRRSFRGALVIVTIATCVALVAMDAWMGGERNRRLRAELEAGADTVLTLAGPELAKAETALASVDPSGEHSTAVAVTRPNDAAALPSLIARPESLRRVAFPSTIDGLDLGALAPPRSEPLTVSGQTLTLTAATQLAGPPQEQVRLAVRFTTPTGRSVVRPLGELPLSTAAPVPLSVPLQCAESCRLDALLIDPPAAAHGADRKGRVTVAGLAVDGRDLGVGGPQGWFAGPGVSLETGPTGALEVSATLSGSTLELRRADLPSPLPALIAGRLPEGTKNDDVQAKGLLNRLVTVRRAEEATQLPGLADRGILLDRGVLGRAGMRLGPQDEVQVWVAPDQPQVLGATRDALAAAGLQVADERHFADLKARYDASGSAWGLSLAVVVAGLSLLVAAAFLVVVSMLGWRSVAGDVAALRLAGVPARVGARALRLEQLLVVGVGLAAGAAAGLMGAWLAMPLVPLFTRPPVRPVPQLGLDPVLLGVAALAALVLLGVCLVTAGVVARRARVGLVRQES